VTVTGTQRYRHQSETIGGGNEQLTALTATRARAAVPADPIRWLLIGVSLLSGLVIAMLTIQLATPWLTGH
jgi:hypothetical protein